MSEAVVGVVMAVTGGGGPMDCRKASTRRTASGSRFHVCAVIVRGRFLDDGLDRVVVFVVLLLLLLLLLFVVGSGRRGLNAYE